MVRELIDVVDFIVGKTDKVFVRALESCSGQHTDCGHY
jgi:hypothetical protein